MFIKVIRAPQLFDAWVLISPEGAHLVRAAQPPGLLEGETAAWFMAEPQGEGWKIVQRVPGERRPCAAPRSGALRRALGNDFVAR